MRCLLAFKLRWKFESRAIYAPGGGECPFGDMSLVILEEEVLHLTEAHPTHPVSAREGDCHWSIDAKKVGLLIIHASGW